VVLGDHDLLEPQVFELHHEVQELGVVVHPGAMELRVLGIAQVADDAQLPGVPPLQQRTHDKATADGTPHSCHHAPSAGRGSLHLVSAVVAEALLGFTQVPWYT
jgi:hypothetical protein